jgi:hypothetical protein
MTEFATRVSEWQAFYNTLGGVSATMAGLLFTSLALNAHLLKNAYLRVVAQQAFFNFSALLLISLLMLQPRQHPITTAIPLGVLGALSFGRILLALSAVRKSGASAENARWASRLMLLSLLAYASLIGFAGLIATGGTEFLRLLQSVAVLLLIGTARLCWELLQHGSGETHA